MKLDPQVFDLKIPYIDDWVHSEIPNGPLVHKRWATTRRRSKLERLFTPLQKEQTGGDYDEVHIAKFWASFGGESCWTDRPA